MAVGERRDLTAESRTFTVPDLVERLAGMAATIDEIAEFAGIPKRTLERRLADKDDPIAVVYRRGIDERQASLLRMMWARAKSSDPTMLIWLSKNLMGWKDRHEFTGKDARALADAMAGLSDEELLELAKKKRARGQTGSPSEE